MKHTIPKNRMIPLIIFAIFIILVAFISGVYQINQMTGYGYEATLNYYNDFAENTASMLKQDINNYYQGIEVSAKLIGQAGELTEEHITEILPLLAEDKSFIDIAIVDMDGIGYNIEGKLVDVSDMMYFIRAKQGNVNVSENITYTEDNNPVLVYAAPIFFEGKNKGVLLETVTPQIGTLTYLEEKELDGSIIYILNQYNELIFCSDSNLSCGFDYDDVIEHGYFYQDYKDYLKSIGIGDFFKIENYNNNNNYVWYQKSIGINDWSVLVGKANIISPISQSIVKVMNLIWIFVVLIIFVLFMLLIITQRKSNRNLIKALYLDPVTGGNNWYKFRNDVNKILKSRLFYKRKFALINFDINRFKVINDSFGYQKGDEVLKDIYKILKRWVNQGEPFTRYAADQFYILLSFKDEAEIETRLKDLNQNLHESEFTRNVRFYFGVYFIVEIKDSVDRMADFANVAKQNIKGSSDEMISYFDEETRQKLLEEEEIEKTMYDALKNEEFMVYLQPKVQVMGENVSGAEALVRWKNKKGSMISPSYFIPIFEKNGFITELDIYMLRKVCQVLRNWRDKGLSPVPISVNISRIHFTNPHLAEMIESIVDEYGVPHELIELELTESAFLQNKQMLIETVVSLRNKGFMISMDDFGAGYSSLNSLKDIPLDVVKLDGELFRITDELERGFIVIRNTISMAKELQMKVVAECIETKDQVEFLSNVGCDIIQGYYYAQPMPIEQFEVEYFDKNNE